MPLIDRLKHKQASIGIIGLGYAGLPMAVEIASAGFSVTGFDVDEAKVGAINAGRSPVSDVASEAVAALKERGLLRASGSFEPLRKLDAAIICVPTPLTAAREPDLRFVEAAADSVAKRLHREMLVVLQSTCAPGTTRAVLLPRLQATGLQVGVDYHLVFAPERIDPGNVRFNVRNTPKLVGGVTERCTEAACAFFAHFIDQVKPVASPDIAEMSKLVENTFRFINISFINEMALLCDRLGINIWEVIDAASTKPFAFLPHYPSPGVGGHCIPVVPLYLEAIAREHGMAAQLIEVSAQINDEMPRMIVRKVREALAERGRELAGARVLLLGVTYKADIADTRESAALRVLEELARRGAEVSYHDPLIGSVSVAGERYESQPLHPEALRAQDCVVILTPHSSVDYHAVVEHAPLVVDTRSGLKPHPSPKVVNVWRPVATRVPTVV
ncbi:MAG: nucleotide sugar dehydrogenase [Chloroflexi bacterium]|nr:nucleotide sugar dehydrogenase [Chloroflexota bacterium]